MFRKMLRGKIHRATVTGADLHYEGSIAVDQNLLDGAGINAFEAVHIWNVNNGQRLMTYAIPAPRGSGDVVLNGAAARLVQKGDYIIIAAFGWLHQAEVENYIPRVVLVDDENRPIEGYTPHGVSGEEPEPVPETVMQEVG
jgi:aspartate 1-decarboxylase